MLVKLFQQSLSSTLVKRFQQSRYVGIKPMVYVGQSISAEPVFHMVTQVEDRLCKQGHLTSEALELMTF